MALEERLDSFMDAPPGDWQLHLMNDPGGLDLFCSCCSSSAASSIIANESAI